SWPGWRRHARADSASSTPPARTTGVQRARFACYRSGPEACMAKEFFDRDMQLFIDHRFDWSRYFRLRPGDGVQVADEVAPFKDVVRSTGEICQSIAEGSRGHWHEEVKLVDGQVVVPPHIAAGYEKLRAAGLLCLTMDPEYGGYGLPALVNTA